MNKIIPVLTCLIFAANVVCAQEVFLTLTRYDEQMDRMPTNVSVISSEDIEQKRAETLGDILQNETGINIREYGSAGALTSVSIRGASSKQTLVLIDGRRINDAGLGDADFSAVAASNIERVEIIRGAGAAVYGTSGFGGVINVITKKASEQSPLIDVGISYGSFNTFNPSFAAAYAGRKASAFAAVSNISSDGDRNNSNYRNLNVFFNGSVMLGEQTKFSASGNIFESVKQLPGSALFSPYEAEQKDGNRYVKADLNTYAGDMTLNISAYACVNKRKYRETTVIPITADDHYTNETAGVQADFVCNNILAGGEWWNESYEKKNYLNNKIMTDKDRVNGAAYAQWNLDVGKFTFIPSLRGDSNSAFGEVFTPAISAVFRLDDTVKFSANCGRVWRAPTFVELYDNYIFGNPLWDVYANPDLKPEYGISSDIGAQYLYENFKLAGTAFLTETDDMIVLKHIPAKGYTYENVDKTRQYGFEIETGHIMTAWLHHKLNYTYIKAQNKDTDKTLDYIPEHTVNYCLTLKPFHNVDIDASAFYRGKQPINAGGDTLKEFFTLDLHINYKISDNLSCWLKGLNITNTDYEMMLGYPMPGAAVYGGVSVKLWR